MKLHPSQQEIVRDTHRFRVVNAGRRFGKSVVAVEELLFAAVMAEANVAYCAPTYIQAREIAWSILKKRVQDFHLIDVNESRLEMTIKNKMGTTSKITLKGWESIESLRGQAFDFLVLDEVAMYRNFYVGWQEVVRPTLTDRVGRVLFISTPKGFNFWYDLYNLEQEDEDFKSFHFTAYDNPYLPAEELEKIKSQTTEDRFAQEILADFRKTEGLVYKEFDRERHVLADKDIYGIIARETLIGVDFGYTNPCAVLSIMRDAADNFYVLHEWYERKHTDVEIAEYVAALKGNRVYPDPEAPAAIAELSKRGVNVREVLKGKDSVKNGIDAVRELLKANKLFIHASCKNLILEFETYVYPDKKDLHAEAENPIKENDHALDALRYVVMMNTGNANTKAKQFYPTHQPVTPTQLAKTNGRVSYPHLPRKQSW